MKCSESGCEKEVLCKSLCRPHYIKARRKITPWVNKIKCSYPDCGRPHNSKGYCTSHFLQFKKGIELRPVKTYEQIRGNKEIKICKKDGCSNKMKAKGFCSNHYNIEFKYNPAPKGIYNARLKIPKGPKLPKPKRVCEIDDCDRDYYCKGMCCMHYCRVKKHGDPHVNYARAKKRSLNTVLKNPMELSNNGEELAIIEQLIDSHRDIDY